MSKKFKKVKFHVRGMKCKSCETVIQDELAKLPGLRSAVVDFTSQSLEVTMNSGMARGELTRAISGFGYVLEDWDETKENTRKFIKIFLSMTLIVGIYYVLYSLDLFPDLTDLSSGVGFGAAFVLGLAAAFSSCAASSGAVLLALSSGALNIPFTKFKINWLFNLGRIVSYAFFGFVLGWLGSLFKISAVFAAGFALVLGIVLVFMGLGMLNLNILRFSFDFGIVNFIRKKMDGWGSKNPGLLVFSSGATTFFLPCGFTQALQLYVLGSGDALSGAMVMSAFALGTLPGLASLGAISQFFSTRFKSFAFYFSGAAIFMVGLFNVSGSLNALGYSVNLASALDIFEDEESIAVPVVPVIGDVQVANMKVVGLDYYPSRFTVKAGQKVRWVIDGREARGCARIITSNELGITKMIPKDKPLIINFTPRVSGQISFSCTMGMTTPGAGFEVVN